MLYRFLIEVLVIIEICAITPICHYTKVLKASSSKKLQVCNKLNRSKCLLCVIYRLQILFIRKAYCIDDFR